MSDREDWQPMSTAPKGTKDILLSRPCVRGDSFMTDVGHYEDNRHAKFVRPYWGSDLERVFGVLWVRSSTPVAWMHLPAPISEAPAE